MGESIHIVGNGTFDYFTLVRHLISLAEQPSKVFYFATWTMSHNNVTQIINLFDEGLIGSINALTGDYFRTRESAIYGALATACQARGQRLFANKNHAKVTLLQFGEDYIVIEGSANFTANPRIEQYVISNHEGLFHFHKEWMDRLLQKSLTEKI